MSHAEPIESGLSRRMRRLFLLGISMMALHKIESWWAHEWEVSGFFAWAAAQVGTIEEGMFYTFVFWLFVGLFTTYGVLAGPRWQQGLFAVYGMTFALELHHLLEALGSGQYYPGMLTAVLYMPLGVFYWSEIVRCIRRLPQRPTKARRASARPLVAPG